MALPNARARVVALLPDLLSLDGKQIKDDERQRSREMVRLLAAFAGFAFSAIAIGALVPAAVMSIGASFFWLLMVAVAAKNFGHQMIVGTAETIVLYQVLLQAQQLQQQHADLFSAAFWILFFCPFFLCVGKKVGANQNAKMLTQGQSNWKVTIQCNQNFIEIRLFIFNHA